MKLEAVTIPEKVALPFAYILAAVPTWTPPVIVATPALTANNVLPAPIVRREPSSEVDPIPTLSKV